MTRDTESKRIITIDDPAEMSSISRMKLRGLGGCRIVAELGHGGMANVFLVVNQGRAGINKLLVLKALREEFASDAEALSMFLDEARVAAQLNHPNVVQTYEVGVHEGRNVLVMEYLEGQSFSRLLLESARVGRPLPLRFGLRIVIAALEGLHYVHELRDMAGNPLELVHRDVSPQNVFVTYDGQVKILDFGIAKAKSSSSQTAIGVVKGKIAYMPPEQMTGAAVDRRTDIYAVGCMLWALATGKKLWHGVPDVQVMARVLSGDLPSLSRERPNFDPRFTRIVDKAMAARPGDRYQTALELQSDLEAYCDALGSPAKSKEIGAFVSDLFAQTRARVRSLIESQLTGPSGESTLSSIQLMEEIPVSASQPVLSSRAPLEISFSQRSETRKPQWLLIIGISAGLSAGGILALLGTERSQTRTSSSAVPPEPVRTSSVASAAPQTQVPPVAPVTPVRAPAATIRFDVKPSDARLFLDGVSLPAEVMSRVMPVDGSKHTLRAEARGYVTRELEFLVTEDASLELRLSKGEVAPSATLRKPVSRREPAPKVTVPPAKADKPAAKPCSDPFFIAEGGIKRVRPECR